MSKRLIVSLVFLIFFYKMVFCAEKGNELKNSCSLPIKELEEGLKKGVWNVFDFENLKQEEKNDNLLRAVGRPFSYIHLLQTMLEVRADLNCQDEHNSTPLFLASTFSPCLVTELLKRNADVNIKNKNGWQPIHGAAATNNFGVLCALLRSGANLFAETPRGDTASSLIKNQKIRELIQILQVRGIYKNPYLLSCLSLDHTHVAKLVAENSDVVNQKDAKGATGLILVARSLRIFLGDLTVQQVTESDVQKSAIRIAEELTRAGIDKRAMEDDGTTALAIAEDSRVGRVIRNSFLAEKRKKIIEWLQNKGWPRVLAEILLGFTGTYEPILL